MTDLQASLEEYRGTREALEAALLPLATSVDGRRFNFQVSLHGLEVEPGGYVAIEGDGSTRLGQLLSLELRQQDTTAPGLGQGRIRAGGAPPRTRWAPGSRRRGPTAPSSTRPAGRRPRRPLLVPRSRASKWAQVRAAVSSSPNTRMPWTTYTHRKKIPSDHHG